MLNEKKAILPEQVRTAVEFLWHCVGTDGVVLLFGSHARGKAKAGRDYDIGLVPRDGTTWRQICVWRSEAQERAWPYKLDVVDLTRAPEEFLDMIRDEAIPLYGEWTHDRLFTEEA